jgi:hypothetical protein
LLETGLSLSWKGNSQHKNSLLHFSSFCVLAFLGVGLEAKVTFLWKVVASINTQSPLRFDAAPFAGVFWPFEWGKLKEGAF